MKKKKFIILIVIFLIILVGLIITLHIMNSKKEAEEELQQQITEKEEFLKEATEKYFSDKICPQGMATLYSNYHGDNDLNDLYRGLYTLVGYITEMYSDVQDFDAAQLEEYYKSYTRKIRTTIGIRTFEDFVEFVNYLKNIGFTAEDKYQYCKIDTETYEENDNYLMFNISFYYEGKENLITLKTYFSNKNYINYTTPKLKFELINQ